MPIRASRPWTGATPLFGMPRSASAGAGMCTSIPTLAWVAPGPSIPCGKAKSACLDTHARTRPPRPWPRPREHRGLGRRAGDPPPRSGARHPSGTDRWCWSDPKGTAAGVRKHTRPRTRTRPSDWGVAPATARAARVPRAYRAAWPQDAVAPADGREPPCAWPERRSAHRTPASFAHSSTVASRTPPIG